MTKAQVETAVNNGKILFIGQFISGSLDERNGVFDGKAFHSVVESVAILAGGKTTIWKRKLDEAAHRAALTSIYPTLGTKVVLELTLEDNRKNPGTFYVNFKLEVLQEIAVAATGVGKAA